MLFVTYTNYGWQKPRRVGWGGVVILCPKSFSRMRRIPMGSCG